MSAHTTRPARVLDQRYIEGLIADGRRIIIFNGNVLKVDTWLPFHPGGDLAILHMVGRDATDEINALHSQEARDYMQKYIIGRTNGRWSNFLPPIQGGQFRKYEPALEEGTAEGTESGGSSASSSAPSTPLFDPFDASEPVRRRRRGSTSSISSTSSTHLDGPQSMTTIFDTRTQSQIQADLIKYPPLDADSQETIVRKYRDLGKRIREQGLYNCSYSAYAWEALRYALLFTTSTILLHYSQYFFSAIFLGLFWHQLAFTAHDAGHMGITHNFHVDTCIGIFIANFCGGLSEGWWKRSHNVHHIVTNSAEHDPDIQHMPFFAISHRFFDSMWSTYHDKIMTFDVFARFMIKFQAYLYYPILLFGRFNLYAQSMIYLFCGLGPKRGPAWWHRWLEFACLIFFWTWFGYGIVYKLIPTAWNRFVFVMISHMVTAPLHVQITLSHFAMSTADLGTNESFPQKMLRTTMDVDCPPWLDFVHGGLQFQAIHHLFPRIPRHNLRKTQKLVQDFCVDAGIPYAIYGFYDGNKEVISRLGDVAQQARYLEECRRVCAEKGVFADHH